MATYGEWRSEEGGARMRVVIVVPNDIEIETRPKLAGPYSVGIDGHDATAGPRRDGIVPSEPAKGWTVVASVPDEDQSGG